MDTIRKILFLSVLDGGYHMQVLQGIMRYARCRPWTVSLISWAYCNPLDVFASMRPDAVIIDALRKEWVEDLDRRVIPWVNIGYRPYLVPTVCAGPQCTARVAAEHLLSRGFRRFAFYGPPDIQYSSDREAAFRAHLARHGFNCISCGDAWQVRAAEWVRSLPKPIAILTANDDQAFELMQACRVAQVRVPEQVAMVGVDNSITSLLCEPALTTVATCSDLIGEQTAQLLDRLMAGESRPTKPIFVESAELIARKSTDATGELQSDIAQAVRFIRDNAHRHLSVADVLRAVNLSRRSLERRFRAELGRGIHEEIRAARIEQVKLLLLTTDLPLSVIADETGYGTAPNLSAVFQRVTSVTPGEFRQKVRVPFAIPQR